MAAAWAVAALVLDSGLVAQETAGAKPADAAAKRPVAQSIGVIDIVKVFDQYPKAIKERERLGKVKASFDARIDQLNKRLEETKATIQTLKKDSIDYRLKVAEYRNGMQQREELGKVYSDELQLENMRSDLELFADIEFAIAQVAKDRGLQLVLRTVEVPAADAGDDEVRSLQLRTSIFDRRQVWYSSGELDITPMVIKFLMVPLERGTPAKDAGSKDAGSKDAPTSGGRTGGE